MEEQRELLANVLSGIRASTDHMTFEIRGLEVALQLEWHGDMSVFVEVAGPGIEPGTP